jgi:hypothetical protein
MGCKRVCSGFRHNCKAREKPFMPEQVQGRCVRDNIWSFIRNFGLGIPQRMALTDTTGESRCAGWEIHRI